MQMPPIPPMSSYAPGWYVAPTRRRDGRRASTGRRDPRPADVWAELGLACGCILFVFGLALLAATVLTVVAACNYSGSSK
jgi:hypothetical protein